MESKIAAGKGDQATDENAGTSAVRKNSNAVLQTADPKIDAEISGLAVKIKKEPMEVIDIMEPNPRTSKRISDLLTNNVCVAGYSKVKTVIPKQIIKSETEKPTGRERAYLPRQSKANVKKSFKGNISAKALSIDEGKVKGKKKVKRLGRKPWTHKKTRKMKKSRASNHRSGTKRSSYYRQCSCDDCCDSRSRSYSYSSR